ncbi:DUF4342 domain-containing protein [Fodinibius sediminis]|uniref:DUF4342 domain-containing protein n=1 Tax=Fodinibius sediminis TaxID=1214077 RepID=A0A521AMK6_9BACT|nr:DUF4342 domain-containing protein [Fodinibius sediminis]SMO36074.1 protein of unknown function [Fodinibius sediminis]
MKNRSSKQTFTEEIKGTASEIIRQVKKLVREGNARRIIIEDKNGKVLFQSQLTVGLAGTAVLTAVAPVVSAISMFALFMNDIKIIVERYPEEEQNDGDEYEVEAEFIEIKDEEEADTAAEEKQQAEKTVGKKGEDSEE